MNFSPVSQYSFGSITDISPDFLDDLGVNFLMLDLDNTLATYTERFPSEHVIKWAAGMASSGIKMFIVSNNRRRGRPERFAKTMNIGFIKSARKPSPAGLLRAMEIAGFNKTESALVGDQVYTDVLAANIAGVVSIVVRPRSLKNPLLALRFALEFPFRAAIPKRAANGRLTIRAE